jgi:hypothetical protein
MIYLIFWILAAYGMSTILVYGSIFETSREWMENRSKFLGKLFNCMLCTSTWVGFFLSLVLGGLCNKFFELSFGGLFIDGMFTAGAVWALNAIIEFFEESRINDTKG